MLIGQLARITPLLGQTTINNTAIINTAATLNNFSPLAPNITTQPIQPKLETQSTPPSAYGGVSPSQSTQATTKMWTGSSWASVNPAYADEYLAKGWTYEGPSQSQMSEMIDVANKGGQAVWTPEGIKNLEGSVTTSTPTSATTSTYTPLPGYQTIDAGKGTDILNALKNALKTQGIKSDVQPRNPITTSLS